MIETVALPLLNVRHHFGTFPVSTKYPSYNIQHINYITKNSAVLYVFQVLNTEEEQQNDDEKEVEELRKRGIVPLPKPPPGVGLLPTPPEPFSFTEEDAEDFQDPSGDFKKIPSLFEIVVKPTVDLAHKIGKTYVFKLPKLLMSF